MKNFGRCIKVGALEPLDKYGHVIKREFVSLNYWEMGFKSTTKPTINELDSLYERSYVDIGEKRGPFFIYFQNEHVIQVTAKSNDNELKMRKLSEEPPFSYDPKLLQASSYPEFLFYCDADCKEVVLDCKCQDESDDFTAIIEVSFKEEPSKHSHTTVRNGRTVIAFGDDLCCQANAGFSFAMITFNWPKSVERTVVTLYLKGMISIEHSNIPILNKIDEISVSDRNQRRVTFPNLPFGRYCFVVRQYQSNGSIYSMTNFLPVEVKNFVGTV